MVDPNFRVLQGLGEVFACSASQPSPASFLVLPGNHVCMGYFLGIVTSSEVCRHLDRPAYAFSLLTWPWTCELLIPVVKRLQWLPLLHICVSHFEIILELH